MRDAANQHVIHKNWRLSITISILYMNKVININANETNILTRDHIQS